MIILILKYVYILLATMEQDYCMVGYLHHGNIYCDVCNQPPCNLWYLAVA